MHQLAQHKCVSHVSLFHKRCSPVPALVWVLLATVLLVVLLVAVPVALPVARGAARRGAARRRARRALGVLVQPASVGHHPNRSGDSGRLHTMQRGALVSAQNASEFMSLHGAELTVAPASKLKVRQKVDSKRIACKTWLAGPRLYSSQLATNRYLH